MAEHRPLGIVGGLGPSATVFYYMEANNICLRLEGRRPRLLVYSIPFEEMCGAVRRGDLEGVASLLLEALESLAGAGVEVALIAANTPHIAWGLVEPKARSMGLRLVSIVDAAVEALAALGARRVAVLATSGTLESRIYHEALEKRGIEVVEPPAGEQEWLDRAISESFAPGSPSREDVERLIKLAERLASESDAVLVACTDLSPYMPATVAGKPVVDSSRAQLEKALGEAGFCTRREEPATHV